MKIHRYFIDLTISGPERYHLADAIVDEFLPLTAQVPIWEVAEKIREGHFHYEHESETPLEDFADNFDALSAYIPQVVKAFHAIEDDTEGKRLIMGAWKILALRGEVLTIPLRLPPTRLLNDLDPDADDLDYIEAHWHRFPRWFQDGMRRKHPVLRRL